ncbi:spermidine synthase [Sulfoacidibacillus thermotolerans]|uniref:PABS domain-containing protein n=1 Tax=Sulfoacidibacillus thermotolerans TaxID=1765684 RepID=A0A2U3D5T7_SULT2|nr:fused MFS/spermidine synthase [Sulfoacidibacillus thermotolerans]PWI56618.1 hypothetical protein BM613_12835 [Sulfoacidibacillus thermotolerans]
MTIIYKTHSDYQVIQVGENRGVRYMRFGDEGSGWQGAILTRQPARLYFPYQQAFALHTAWRPTVNHFLAIGVGTGTAISHVHRRHKNAKITGIDIDDQVIVVAERFFGLPTDERTHYFAEDAGMGLRNLTDAFDLIFIDVFFREQTPKIFFSTSFFQDIEQHLVLGGIVAMNVILPIKGPLRHAFWDLYARLQRYIGPTYYIALGPVPFISQNVILFSQKASSKALSLSTLRKKCLSEIEQHKNYFSTYAKILPWRLKSE